MGAGFLVLGLPPSRLGLAVGPESHPFPVFPILMNASKKFSLLFMSALGLAGMSDAIRHFRMLSLDPTRPEAERGTDSAGALLGHYRGNLDVTHASWGDLSRIGRLLPFRHGYLERYVTDAFGFRNAGNGGPYDAVILGDCFLGGDAGELFHEDLEKESGLRIYDYEGLTAREFLADPRFARAPPLLIVERVERGFNGPWARKFMASPGIRPAAEAAGDARYTKLHRLFDVSPHSLVAEQMQWLVATARYFFLHRLPKAVPLYAARNRMLFFREETEEHARGPAERCLAETLDSLASLRRLAEARRMRLLVIMVPDKYTLYGKMADGAAPEDSAEAWRAAAFAGLKERGIDFVDLFPEFLSEARLESDPAALGDSLLYYSDDTRWAPKGRRLAARVAAAQGKLRRYGPDSRESK
jgi:hypothetical protein